MIWLYNKDTFEKPGTMKLTCLLFLSSIPFLLRAQSATKTKNIFIITTDGFRWQEVFTGADSALINNSKYTSDTSITKQLYWDDSVEMRRKKLMPFFWSVIASKGQLYGNRFLSNKVNMRNLYKISYPGYNEILTGYADWHLIPNTAVNNKNTNILEYLNKQPAFNGKVVAFTSWNIFPYIINEERSNLTVNSGYEKLQVSSDSTNDFINLLQETIVEKKHTRYDLLTSLSAREYIQTKHPKIVFLGLGETDESAHSNRYDLYLQQANMVDKLISDLWYYVQTDPFYKDNTSFIITTDHGRGNTTRSWHTHGPFTPGSGQTWMAIVGPDIVSAGEIMETQQLYGNQLAATIARLLGERFEARHPVGNAINLSALGYGNASVSKGR
jgi:hypothetical protein